MKLQKRVSSCNLRISGLSGTGATVLALIIGISLSFDVLAQGAAKNQGKMEYAYSLNDESVLGRYGDENDEYIASASVPVNTAAMDSESKKQLPKTGDGKLGAFSLKDGSREGHYGDGIYSVSEE